MFINTGQNYADIISRTKTDFISSNVLCKVETELELVNGGAPSTRIDDKQGRN